MRNAVDVCNAMTTGTENRYTCRRAVNLEGQITASPFEGSRLVGLNPLPSASGALGNFQFVAPRPGTPKHLA